MRSNYFERTRERWETVKPDFADDLTFAQAVGNDVDWGFVADMAVRQGTNHEVKRFLTGAAWGVVPTPLWLAKHGWEFEVVCQVCGRSDVLGHAMVGCGKDEEAGLQAWAKTFGPAHQADEEAMRVQARYIVKEGLVQEFRKRDPRCQGHP